MSHEALFKAWPLLSRWLNEERSFLAGKAQLGRLLADWQAAPAHEKSAALLSGLNLARARQWLATHRAGLSDIEVRFIQASGRRDRARKIGAYALVSATLLVLASVGARWGYGEYVRRTSLECDLLAVEPDNNIFVPGVEFDRIDTARAIPACEWAVERDPGNPRLLHNLGRSLDKAGRYEDAVYRYRQAAERGSTWSQTVLASFISKAAAFVLGFGLIRRAATNENTSLPAD